MSPAVGHSSWRKLLDISGPFLTVPVLERAFPQGLDAVGAMDRLRAAYDEWEESQSGGKRDPETQRLWTRFVLEEVLGHTADDLREGQSIPAEWTIPIPEQREALRPDLAIVNPVGRPDAGKGRLLVRVVPSGTDLEKPVAGSGWNESHAGRMAILLRALDIRLGLLTDGERWMLVDAPKEGTTGFTSWYADLWLEERQTLAAFKTLLGPRRFFGVPEAETLEALFDQSTVVEQEVTEQLGRQVRRAVEILVAALDRVNRDLDGALLDGIPEGVVYESAVTFMMRLVFLFCAEERGLFPVDEELYGGAYAASTLREQLREAAEQWGEEVLERRTDAWQRLLALFRVVHGGAQHEDLRLPPYGGHLVDPDRYPFLEGRKAGTTYRTEPAKPIPVDNRTVLHLLEALQLVHEKGHWGDALQVSFRSLDIEQIGHVYEGLLDHTVRKADDVVLSLAGKDSDEPEVTLSELERHRRKGEDALIEFVSELSGRSVSAVRKALESELLPEREHAFLVACGNDKALAKKIRPFAGLVRSDAFERPVVILPGSLFMTQGTDRRQTGTHYTPRSLTEPIVRYALEPLVYEGPAEGKPREQWVLRPAREILALKVCDIACGSGAFLVAACRYLASRLVEAWSAAEASHPGKVVATPEGELSQGKLGESLVPGDAAERIVYAQRLVAGRCLYGVDINELAAEMARLSLWLITLDKGKPFTFLDHAIKAGDSLLGVTSLEQLEAFSLDPTKKDSKFLFLGDACRRALEFLARKRTEIEETPTLDIRDIQHKEDLLRESESGQVQAVRGLGNVLMILRLAELAGLEADRTEVEEALAACFDKKIKNEAELSRRVDSLDKAYADLLTQLERGASRKPFHWPIEFPEVFGGESADERGFHASIGNPPFRGGKLITGILGTDYREYLVRELGGGVRGHADLCAYFFLRSGALLRKNGMAGLLATNTIAQGDSREVSLEGLVANGFSIPRAVPSRRWPGSASLEVAHVWLRKGEWRGSHMLNDRAVGGIGPMLTVPSRVIGKPFRLAANAGRSFQGSIVLGLGFVLEPEEAKELIHGDRHNRDVLYPYLNGEDLNSRPDQTASRWVINFHNWPLNKADAPKGYDGPVAADYPECLAIVREKVRPERARKARDVASAPWWQFWRGRGELYAAIKGLKRVLVTARVSPTLAFAFVGTRQVLHEKTVVLPTSRSSLLALLQSSQHGEWARVFSSTLGGTTINYSPSDCFDTFPLPAKLESLEAIGEEYAKHRRDLMSVRQEGLTKIYNRFHDPRERSKDIWQLRDLHVRMDQAVATAYGWGDLDLGHGNYETKQGPRFTISRSVCVEVLDRLIELNHTRYTEEVRAGLHEKRVSRKSEVRVARAAAGWADAGLFDDEDSV